MDNSQALLSVLLVLFPGPSRKVLSGIFYVLRTGCQGKAVPAEFGSGSNIHRYVQEWEKAGFFQKIWARAMEEYDDLKGIGWEWQSVDGSMVKAPLAQSAAGPNPTDRGKMGTKRIVLSDEHGLPLAIVLDGANRHDSKLLEDTLDDIALPRPEVTEEHPQNLCLDAGYTGKQDAVTDRHYKPHIVPRGEEKKRKEKNPDYQARRWIVEALHSHLNRFRKLLVRYKKNTHYLALIQFACAVIVWRKLIPVH